MAVRKPLYYNANQVKEMTTSMVTEIVHQTCYQYALNPSVTITVAASNQGATSHFPTITDTRYKSGAAATHVSSFASAESLSGNPVQVPTAYERMVKNNASVSPTTDTGKTWPVYQTNNGDIKAMSIADIKDTFLHPAIDLLIAAGTPNDQQGGTYTITTSSTPASNFTLIGGGNVVFTDSKADISGMTGGEIGTAGTFQTDNTVEANYYLHIRDAPADPSYTDPLFITSGNDLQTYSSATFKALLQEWIRETASQSSDGYQILYNIDGSGNTRASMTNKEFQTGGGGQTGDPTELNRGVNTDDYRAQEVPGGTLTTANTYVFKITKG